jgi:ABC-2 type transport system permease protein
VGSFRVVNFTFDASFGIPADQLRLGALALYGGIALILSITAGIVGWFYCLDALSSERRERSILFWRSLPLSDVTTVLSKVLVGMAVVPLASLIVSIALYLVMLVVTAIVLAAQGANGLSLFANASFGEAILVHIYAATAAILWGAPLYAWAIFVSSWARRATFLWALMVPAGIALAEFLAFGTRYFLGFVASRFEGGIENAFAVSSLSTDDKHFKFDSQLPESLLTFLDPVRFLSQPGLWVGLVLAAAFIAAAIWFRRYREPL